MGFSRQEYWTCHFLWVAISSSRRSSQPRDQSCISCASCTGRILYPLSHLGSPLSTLSILYLKTNENQSTNIWSELCILTWLILGAAGTRTLVWLIPKASPALSKGQNRDRSKIRSPLASGEVQSGRGLSGVMAHQDSGSLRSTSCADAVATQPLRRQEWNGPRGPRAPSQRLLPQQLGNGEAEASCPLSWETWGPGVSPHRAGLGTLTGSVVKLICAIRGEMS